VFDAGGRGQKRPETRYLRSESFWPAWVIRNKFDWLVPVCQHTSSFALGLGADKAAGARK
jgi:hypothetical protein